VTGTVLIQNLYSAISNVVPRYGDPKRDGATAVYLQKASHQRREVQAKSTGGRVGL